MKSKKKTLFIILTIIMLISTTQNYLYINSNAVTGNQVNVAVLVSNPQDPYLALISQGLENIENNNKDKVKFTFYDTKANQSIEAETLDTILKNNVDLILGNLVDTKVDSIENFIDKIKQKKYPSSFI